MNSLSQKISQLELFSIWSIHVILKELKLSHTDDFCRLERHNDTCLMMYDDVLKKKVPRRGHMILTKHIDGTQKIGKTLSLNWIIHFFITRTRLNLGLKIYQKLWRLGDDEQFCGKDFSVSRCFDSRNSSFNGQCVDVTYEQTRMIPSSRTVFHQRSTGEKLILRFYMCGLA